MKEFVYLSENEKFNGGYMIIPNALYTLNFYKGLSNDAILLYGILLSRFKMSKKNSMVDEKGRVYVVAPTASIMELLDVAKGTARKVVTELETYLLLKIEQEGGYNSKRRFYLGAITKDKTLRSGKKICNTKGSNSELSGDKISTIEGSNNELGGDKICTIDEANIEPGGDKICTMNRSNIEPSRGQNLYPNKNINKYNIKNSQTQWGNGGACENSNDFDFSD